jgi:hypothetical protein
VFEKIIMKEEGRRKKEEGRRKKEEVMKHKSTLEAKSYNGVLGNPCP